MDGSDFVQNGNNKKEADEAKKPSEPKTGIDYLKSYPNPFFSSTNIEFQVWDNVQVQLQVVDISGKVINDLYNATVENGTINTVEFNAGQLPGGIYFIRMITPDEVKVMQVMHSRN